MTTTLCDVCVLLDNDSRPKECTFCKLCGKWICRNCNTSPLRRALAAFKQKFVKG